MRRVCRRTWTAHEKLRGLQKDADDARSEGVQELVEQLASAGRLLEAARAEGRELENRLEAAIRQRNELQEERDNFKLLAEQRGGVEDRLQKQVGYLEEKFRGLQKDVDHARFQAEETTAEVDKLTKEVARVVEENENDASNRREDVLVLRLETTYKEQLAQVEQRESDLRSEIASLEGDRAKFTSAEAKFQRSETELKILLKQQKAAAQKEQTAADKREKALQDKLTYTTREMQTIKTELQASQKEVDDAREKTAEVDRLTKEVERHVEEHAERHVEEHVEVLNMTESSVCGIPPKGSLFVGLQKTTGVEEVLTVQNKNSPYFIEWMNNTESSATCGTDIPPKVSWTTPPRKTFVGFLDNSTTIQEMRVDE